MPEKDKYYGVAEDLVLSFLQKTLPFNELSHPQLENLAQTAVVAFYPKGKLDP